MNYYNEYDPHAAAWLRELIESGHIPPGDVDQRSIEDVCPTEITGYVQCHFFAGIGGWPLALRLAGWPEDRPVWTGSCPCQPFSTAGAQGGTDDERHLWPAFRWLIDQCRPPAVFGEQVASKAGREWLAGVQTDLQAMGYATAGADLCAAGVGAPHIRQRLWWVGHSVSARLEGHAGNEPDRDQPGWQHTDAPGPAGATGSNSWDTAIWTPCADGKARRIKPGIKPLVNGLPRGVVPSSDPGAPGYAQNTGEARKMRLSGYGNAIVPQVAAEFIRAAGSAT